MAFALVVSLEQNNWTSITKGDFLSWQEVPTAQAVALYLGLLIHQMVEHGSMCVRDAAPFFRDRRKLFCGYE